MVSFICSGTNLTSKSRVVLSCPATLDVALVACFQYYFLLLFSVLLRMCKRKVCRCCGLYFVLRAGDNQCSLEEQLFVSFYLFVCLFCIYIINIFCLCAGLCFKCVSLDTQETTLSPIRPVNLVFSLFFFLAPYRR